MSFIAKLQRAREVLEQQKRLSVRALAREIDMGGDELEELITELVEVLQVARRDGAVLALDDAPSMRPAQALAVSPVREPRSYTPKHLADKILDSKPALEGERKTITALFADLKGSTALLEGLDPEEARAIIDPALQIMMDAVHRYEGYVAQALTMQLSHRLPRAWVFLLFVIALQPRPRFATTKASALPSSTPPFGAAWQLGFTHAK